MISRRFRVAFLLSMLMALLSRFSDAAGAENEKMKPMGVNPVDEAVAATHTAPLAAPSSHHVRIDYCTS